MYSLFYHTGLSSSGQLSLPQRMDVIVKWHEICQNLLLKLALQFPLNSFHQRIAARVNYGAGGRGGPKGGKA